MFCRERQRVHAAIIAFVLVIDRRRYELQITEDWVSDMWYMWLAQNAAHTQLVSNNYVDYADFVELCAYAKNGGTSDAYHISFFRALYYVWKKPLSTSKTKQVCDSIRKQFVTTPFESRRRLSGAGKERNVTRETNSGPSRSGSMLPPLSQAQRQPPPSRVSPSRELMLMAAEDPTKTTTTVETSEDGDAVHVAVADGPEKNEEYKEEEGRCQDERANSILRSVGDVRSFMTSSSEPS